jgi:hypothetical protein
MPKTKNKCKQIICISVFGLLVRVISDLPVNLFLALLLFTGNLFFDHHVKFLHIVIYIAPEPWQFMYGFYFYNRNPYT